MSKKYVVTAPYITVTVGTVEGQRLLGFYKGAHLPDDVSAEAIKHHLDAGMIAEEGAAEKILQAEPGEVPSNTGSEPALYSEVDTGDESKAAKAAPAKAEPAKAAPKAGS